VRTAHTITEVTVTAVGFVVVIFSSFHAFNLHFRSTEESQIIKLSYTLTRLYPTYIMDVMEVVLEQRVKARKTQFPWTESRKFSLVNYVCNVKGKFNTIRREIIADRIYPAEFKFDGAAFKKKCQQSIPNLR
jgi:hypothetical protein